MQVGPCVLQTGQVELAIAVEIAGDDTLIVLGRQGSASPKSAVAVAQQYAQTCDQIKFPVTIKITCGDRRHDDIGEENGVGDGGLKSAIAVPQFDVESG